MSLQNRFYNSLLKSGCVPCGSRVLVAVSGGADSVALLSLLCSVADTMELSLEVAHLDHALRATSGRDARFVERLCADRGLFLTTRRIDVAAAARQCKGNLEEVARELRREFLFSVAEERQCDLVALGQHLDDQAETFLMRLLRGSGTSGLTCMRPRDGLLVRPLLPFERGEIIAYLEEEGLAWQEDESNSDPGFTRNRIRQQLVPLLKTFNPNISRQLGTFSEQLQRDDEFWEALVEEELSACSEWRKGVLVLARPSIQQMQPALSARVVRDALRSVRGDLRGLSSVHVEDVLKLLQSDAPQGDLCLPGAHVARRYDELLFSAHKPLPVPCVEVAIDGPGKYELPGGEALVVTLEAGAGSEDARSAEFDAATLTFPLLLRSVRPGDRVRPSGMSGTKKIQDLFVDLKMPREERREALLLMKDDEVLWVAGVRRSALFVPGAGTPVLRVALEC